MQTETDEEALSLRERGLWMLSLVLTSYLSTLVVENSWLLRVSPFPLPVALVLAGVAGSTAGVTVTYIGLKYLALAESELLLPHAQDHRGELPTVEEAARWRAVVAYLFSVVTFTFLGTAVAISLVPDVRTVLLGATVGAVVGDRRATVVHSPLVESLGTRGGAVLLAVVGGWMAVHGPVAATREVVGLLLALPPLHEILGRVALVLVAFSVGVVVGAAANLTFQYHR